MNNKKLGLGMVGAGVFVLMMLFWTPFSGGLSDSDVTALEMLRQRSLEQSELEESNLVPTITASQREVEHHSLEETKEHIIEEIDQLFAGEVEDGVDPVHYHQNLALVAANWGEFSTEQQEYLEPYMLEPTNPDSFFHVSNWPESNRLVSRLLRLKNFLVPFAVASSLDDAGTVAHFEDPSGYEYFESTVFDLRVYYPSQDMLPDGDFLHPDVSSYPGVDIDEQNYNYLMVTAFDAMEAAEQAYLEFKGFFGAALGQSARIYIIQSVLSGAQGVTLDCQRIYVPHAYFGGGHAFQIETIAAHELFHCFQQDRGFAQVADGLEALVENVTTPDDRRAWIREGTAAFSQYLANMSEVDTHYFFEKYMPDPAITLFSKTYRAALYWQSIYDEFGPSEAKNLMMAYQPSFGYSQGENEEHAQLMHENFHQIGLNVSGIEELYDNGVATQPIDEYPVNLGVEYVELDINEVNTINSVDLYLEEMSMQYFDFLLGAHGGYLRFDFGDEINREEENIEISAVLYAGDNHTYEKVELQEDEDGNKYVIFCLNENEVCEIEGREAHQGLYRVMLVITNRSGQDIYSGHYLATLFGPKPYEGFFVVMNEGEDNELEVPIKGTLDLTINTDEATVRMDAHKFWMAFENDFYDWDAIEVPESPNVGEVNIHPTRLTRYVNNFCHFRGFIEFDFEPLAEHADDDPWLTRKFKLTKTDQGNFYVMKHKFACKMDPKMFKLLGVNGPAVVVLQTMFAKINTTDYPDGSFAMNLHRIFKEFMTLGLWSDEEGEVELMFMNDGDDYEIVKIEFNDKLHLYFEREG